MSLKILCGFDLWLVESGSAKPKDAEDWPAQCLRHREYPVSVKRSMLPPEKLFIQSLRKVTWQIAISCRPKQLPLISIWCGTRSYLFLVGCSVLMGKMRTQKDMGSPPAVILQNWVSPNPQTALELPVLIFQLPDHLWAWGQMFSAPCVHKSGTLEMTQFFLVLLGKAVYGAGEMAQWVNVIAMKAWRLMNLQWKDSIDPWKLSSDLYLCFVAQAHLSACAHPCTLIHRNTQYTIKVKKEKWLGF